VDVGELAGESFEGGAQTSDIDSIWISGFCRQTQTRRIERMVEVTEAAILILLFFGDQLDCKPKTVIEK
jgi:hypothetical protein